MSTVDDSSYHFPPTMVSDAVWMNWNIHASPPVSHDESSNNLGFAWHPTVFALPEYHVLPSDHHFTNQCATPLTTTFPTTPEAMTTHFVDSGSNVTQWLPSFNAGAFSIPSTAPFRSTSPTRESTSHPNSPPEASSPHYLDTPLPEGSSPSDSNHTFPAPSMPLTHRNPKRTTQVTTKSPIRCYEHSCGGRAFSSPGNYERHLREKSGRAKSFRCELCGQSFTRSTAKNKHVRYGRCRMRALR